MVVAPRPPAPPTLPERLATLVTLAGQLCLDLVIEVRRQPGAALTWAIRYDAPGAPPPAEQRGRFDSLGTALDAVTVAGALHGLHQRALRAPAYLVIPDGPPSPPTTDDLDVQRLEKRIRTYDEPAVRGAQAIWRDGRWWHTKLRLSGPSGSDAGRCVRDREPPEPSWQGPSIPYVDCPDCATTSSNGLPPRCRTCRGARRSYLGTVVTITDLDGQVMHLNWLADPDRPLRLSPVALQPDGTPVVALPSHYRLAHWAHILGVRPEHLTELGTSAPVDPGSRDGLIPLADATDDPLTLHLSRLSAGRPAARLLVRSPLPDAPTLAELIRLVHGLGLALAVTVEVDQRRDGFSLRTRGEGWQVDVLRVDQADRFAPQRPYHPSLASAVAACYAYLELAIASTVPTDPRQPIPVPQSSATSIAPDDPEGMIRQLGRRHPGQPVTAILTPTGCHVHT
ncbi:hypothetical protein BDK92_3918 [Micromonospora pisi]|uniref:Uncharacterized protein n=1 Tax=Micromonospora pisi TaxID=589240 RepID=A0A495JKY0_9ACTN|nr:hypothetical protein [Micromonospora pisi]RKR89563.1 hypothetical protein BDK92_3918 [Micromonospora pisi]